MYGYPSNDPEYTDDWGRHFTNCTDELGLCKTNLPYKNASKTTVPQVTRAEKLELNTLLTYTLELGGTNIPPNYSCQWKFMTEYISNFSFYIRFYEDPKVVKKPMTLQEIDENFNISVVGFPAYNFGVNGQVKLAYGNKIGEEKQLYKEGKAGLYFFD